MASIGQTKPDRWQRDFAAELRRRQFVAVGGLQVGQIITLSDGVTWTRSGWDRL